MKLLISGAVMTVLCLSWLCSCAQNTDAPADNQSALPASFFGRVQKKYASLESALSRKTNKYLERLQRQEKKLRKKLARHKEDGDSSAAGNTDSVYHAFKQQLAADGQRIKEGGDKVSLTEYNSYIDTLSTSLEFLKGSKGLEDQVKLPADALNDLKSKLNESGKIKEFIAQRKEQLKNELAGYAKLPASLQKEYARLNKTIYYYSAQVQEYKDMLKDPAKMERKALSLLKEIPAFQKFMKENSQLASLFGLPGDYGTPASLAGLQTRASVQGLIQQRIAAGGPNAMSTVRQNLQEAQSKLNELKEKLSQISSGGGDIGDGDLPGFKPNTQKTKPFLKRLEYGLNVQFDKSNNLLPASSNMALTLGYKLNDKGAVGIGMSYKLGLGTIQHIRFTSQGIGLRSYIDWKIPSPFGSSKGGMWGGLSLSGGYEMNYNTAFKTIAELRDAEAWQQSALLGISKKVGNISAPFGKKKGSASVQLLYDFLAREHVPVSSPVVFRFGYKF